MSEIIFIQLAIILLVAFVLSYIVRLFKQPIIIGYIIAGIVISPFIISFGASQEVISIFSQFGVAFLLFIVGLHLNPRIIKEIGTSSLVVGIIQMALTFALGFLVSLYFFGFDVITSSYIGIALSFSSTIIILKLLSDQNQLDSLYGKISIGILIIQDLVAVAVLMFISSTTEGTSLGSFAIKGLLGGGAIILLLFLAGFYVLPRVTKSIARSQELLFLFSITWAFAIAALFSYLGFSIEIGALIAGMVLSISPYSTEISSKIRSLRDFFLIIFFIILGLNIQISSLSSIIVNAIILSIIAMIFKPLVLMTFLAMFGYTKRTNFFAGTTLAQISEFSLIVLALGVAVGHISGEILSTITLTGVITITLSTYLIIYSNKIYKKAYKFAAIFEKKRIKKERKIKKSYDAVLFGYNRIGFSILRSLKKIKKSYLIVDFNPDVISDLTKLRMPCLYGDVDDEALLQELPLDKTQLAISTIPEYETNILLIDTIKQANPKAIIIVRAHTIKDAMDLYKKGANYVLTPHFLGGEYLANMLNEIKTDKLGYKDERERHLRMLTERLKKGHEHPEVEKN
jgi:Kef-type K+ transport system membrane component KefB/Trk K+ transport system NAD-binding subunit